MDLLLALISFLFFWGFAQAQNNGCTPLTTAIVASVFGTLGFFLILFLIYFLLERCCREQDQSRRNSPVVGYDNPITIADIEREKTDRSDGVGQGQGQENKNDLSRRPTGSYKRPTDDDQVVTIFLDQKKEPTNGFDVAQSDSGDIVVSSVRRHGPADGKLQEGDIIESITVFFDGIAYEDALGLLSKAAPYPIAVSVSQKVKNFEKQNESIPVETETIYPVLTAPETQALMPQNASTTNKVLPSTFVENKDENKTSDSDENNGNKQTEMTDSPDTSKDLLAVPKQTESDENDSSSSSSSLSSSSNEGTLHIEHRASFHEITQLTKREEITFISGWRKVVKLTDLIQARLVEEETVRKLEFGQVEVNKIAEDLKQYLKGNEPIAGVQIMTDNSKLSLYDATKSLIIRRGTAVGLLEAQAATGSIINPYNGEKMNVNEAVQDGLLDRQLATILSRAEKAVHGFKTKLADKPLSLFEAMNRKLVMESHGIRLLEAQIATGGIIDPHANHRLPEEVAFERGLFDERLHKILETPDDDTKGFFDPNTDENLTYLELMDRCILDLDTGFLLLPIYGEKQKKDYWKK